MVETLKKSSMSVRENTKHLNVFTPPWNFEASIQKDGDSWSKCILLLTLATEFRIGWHSAALQNSHCAPTATVKTTGISHTICVQ